MHLAHDINLFRFFTGQSGGSFMTPQEARSYPVSSQLAAFIKSRENGRAVGTPGQVRDQISQLVGLFDVDEIMAVTNMYHLEDRKRSFQLLKEAFD